MTHPDRRNGKSPTRARREKFLNDPSASVMCHSDRDRDRDSHREPQSVAIPRLRAQWERHRAWAGCTCPRLDVPLTADGPTTTIAALDAARNAARALYAAQADGHPDGTHTLTTTEQRGAAA